MRRDSIERRLREIRARVDEIAPAPPSAELAWLQWCSDAEIDWSEKLFRRWEVEGIEPTKAEQLRFISIECAALARMIDGARRPSGPYAEAHD